MVLKQLGVGSDTEFLLTNNEQTWEDFLGERSDLESIKTYVYLKASLLYSPPTNPFVVASIESQIAQFEQNLNAQEENDAGMNSILNSVKKALGIDADDEHFDQDIILNINSVFMVLNQLGIGPDEGFYISNATQTWTDFLEERIDLEAVKIYVYLKVRLLFDPPSSAFVLDSIDRQITQLEWRLNVQVENTIVEEET
jgi:hypothetical protein